MGRFASGLTVRVVKGDFAGSTGVVLDQNNARDPKGAPLPPTRPGSGYFWVMLSLKDKPFPAHLFCDEIQVLASEPGAVPQFDGS